MGGTASTKTEKEPTGFWRDWSTRLGMGLGAVTIIGNSIYGVLTSVGIVRRWGNPPTLQERMEFETQAMYFFVIPFVVSVFLILIAADRALKRARKNFKARRVPPHR